MSIKRYDLQVESKRIDDDGDWVYYEDHLAEIEELKKEVMSSRIRPTKGDLEIEIERYKRALEWVSKEHVATTEQEDGYCILNVGEGGYGGFDAKSFPTPLDAIEAAMKDEQMKIKIYCEDCQSQGYRVDYKEGDTEDCPNCEGKGYRAVSLEELIKPIEHSYAHGQGGFSIAGERHCVVGKHRHKECNKEHAEYIKSCLNMDLLK